MKRLNGTQLCVSSPGKPYSAPSGTSSLAPITPTAAAPVPTDLAEGTNTKCAQYYKAVSGDYCNLITIKFGISLADFTFLNPEINANCTNLFAEESYCVQAVGDINTYSGKPGYATATSVATAAYTPYSDIPTATATTNYTVSTGLPFANGTRSDCNFYFNGSVFQGDVSFYASQCELAAAVYSVDPDTFNSWNQGINVSDPNCSFQSGVQYCGKLYFGDQAPADAGSLGYPIRDGASPNCTDYADVYDGRTCQDILDTYVLTIKQFYAYNPAVGSDCSNLWAEYQYCVRTPDYIDEVNPPVTTGTHSISTSTPTKPSPTAPTQSGEPDNCNKWYTAQDGDSCSSVANAYFITLDQFYAWNPAVSKDCSSGFWLNEAYCVGTTDTVSQTRSSTSAPTTTTSSVPVPTPNQANNAVSNCNKFAQAQDGDYCSVSTR
jgi:LysM repeat protein